jgi:hypothetical protein
LSYISDLSDDANSKLSWRHLKDLKYMTIIAHNH